MASCWQQEALPVFSLPVPLQQITTSLGMTSTAQHFPRDSPSQKMPSSAQTRWEKATGISCSSSTLQDLLFWIMDHKVPSQPHGKETTATPNSCSWALPVNPISDPTLSAFMVESLDPYHWKGNDVRILPAAHSIPYLPLCTGT